MVKILLPPRVACPSIFPGAARVTYGQTVTEEPVDGLDGPIEIVRDQIGVPHCYAASEHDAFFAQGWVHATDRLWQMEYDRRRALGRWAEVVGSPGVASDLFYRRIDLAGSARRDWAALAPRTRAMLEAYSAGANAGMTSKGGRRLPRDLQLAGVVPQTWEPWHCLLVFKVRHVLMGSARPKLWRAVAADVLGTDAAKWMLPGGDHLACVPPGAPCEDLVSVALADEGGSNNWALSGSRTASGLPLLAGDPHRALELPNVYVQGHLSCPAWDVLGIGMAGVAGFPHFGHNQNVAWSITHGMIDDQDLFRYASPPEGARRVESVEVRNANPVDVEVVTTPQGPLLAPDLALCWTATIETDTSFDAVPPMLDATCVAELFEAMRMWVAPGNNLLAADRDGTIGYLTRGRVPIRRRREGILVPVPGDDPSYAWDGFLAFEDHPQLLNPDKGFLFSANNPAVASSTAGPYLGIDVAAPWRARRLVDVLSGMDGATVADMEDVHGDVVSLPARRWTKRLSGWAPVADWDGTMDAQSRGAAAYSVFRRELMLLALERSGLGANLNHRLNRLIPDARPETAIWQVVDQHARSGETGLLGGWSWDEAVAETLARAQRTWKGETWGELHHTAQRHPLGRSELDPPSVPYAGDMDTVQAASYLPTMSFAVQSASVARYAFDLGEWDRSGWVIPLGSSGRHRSPHFADQQEAWQEGRLLVAPYSRAAVEAAAEERLVLRPARH
jgi:penicillin amidase